MCLNSLMPPCKAEEIQGVIWFPAIFDYLLKTRVPDMSAYRKLLGDVAALAV